MAFCKKCGASFAEGARFCGSCGERVEAVAENRADEYKERKHLFVGTIRKCPNCGEQIGTETTKCPACGFIIEKRNVSSTMDSFVKKFTSISDNRARREFIESYVVPNNKEDIRDILTYAASQRDKDYATDTDRAFWVEAWNNKCRQIVNQATDTFGADSEFVAYLKDYKASVEKSSRVNEKLKKKLRGIEAGKKRAVAAKKFFKGFGIAVAVLAVLGGAGFGIRSCVVKRAEQETNLKRNISGTIIPKDNVALGGILSAYCIVTSDAKVTHEIQEDEKTEYGVKVFGKRIKKTEHFWIVTRTISVDVRMIADINENYKHQCEELLNGKNASEYEIKLYDVSGISASLGTREDGTIVQNLLSVQNGKETTIYGTYSTNEKFETKKDAEKALKELASNPATHVTLSSSPEICVYGPDAKGTKSHKYYPFK